MRTSSKAVAASEKPRKPRVFASWDEADRHRKPGEKIVYVQPDYILERP